MERFAGRGGGARTVSLRTVAKVRDWLTVWLSLEVAAKRFRAIAGTDLGTKAAAMVD